MPSRGAIDGAEKKETVIKKKIKQMNKYKCFVLTVNEPDKIYQSFQNQLFRWEVSVQSGTSASLSEVDFDYTSSLLLYGENLTKGEVLCSLGHREMWRNALKSDHEWVMFLEDDAIFDQRFFSDIEILLQLKFDRPVSLILGHSKTIKKNLWFQSLKQPITTIFSVAGNKFGNKEVDFFGTVAYLINKKGLKLLNNLPRNFWRADHWEIYKNFGLGIYHPKKPLVWENFTSRKSATGNILKVQHNLISKDFFRELYYLLRSRY